MPYPNAGYPSYPGQPMAGNWQVAPPQPAMPVMAAMAGGKPNQVAAPRPTIRLQAPENLPIKQAAPLAMPSPEALGIRAAQPTAAVAPALDWNDAHARLNRLGAMGFHLDRQADGSIRAIFMLPAGGQQAHQIEVVAGTEAAAVTAALQSAESWSLARK